MISGNSEIQRQVVAVGSSWGVQVEGQQEEVEAERGRVRWLRCVRRFVARWISPSRR